MFDTIAVIDHNSDRRNVFYDVLTELNYHVTTVPSSKELMDFLKRERPKCVILAAEQVETTAAILRRLRTLDKAIKVVVLASPEQLSSSEGSLTTDARVLVLNEQTDRLALIRSILSFLKMREVERVEPQTTQQGDILIIEDDPRATDLLKGYLERRGYQVTTVANGEEALVQMRVKQPRIAILDILLPGMDGLLTLRRLKAISPSVCIIVTSGLEDPRLMEEAKTLGAAAYLVKPFDLAKLEATILTSTIQLKE